MALTIPQIFHVSFTCIVMNALISKQQIYLINVFYLPFYLYEHRLHAEVAHSVLNEDFVDRIVWTYAEADPSLVY